MTDKIRMQHILDAIVEVEKYPTGVSFEGFPTNSEKRFATIKQIEIIGEACNHITKDVKQTCPEIEWGSINHCLFTECCAPANSGSEIHLCMNN